MDNRCYYIPKYINRNYVLIWKKDEFIFYVAPLLLCFAPGGYVGFALAFILIIFFARLLKQLGADRPDGYMKHWIRYNMPKQFIAAFIERSENLEPKKSLISRAETFPPAHIRHIAG